MGLTYAEHTQAGCELTLSDEVESCAQVATADLRRLDFLGGRTGSDVVYLLSLFT